tara:strand:- start:129 stop:251 length:123 start_codon:yes stop_codon:yes gene_type:complete
MDYSWACSVEQALGVVAVVLELRAQATRGQVEQEVLEEER